VQPLGLGNLKKLRDLISNRTSDLPACRIAPRPTTLPRSQIIISVNTWFIFKCGGKRPLVKSTRMWEDNIKMGLRGIKWSAMD
jgi:hypothetical protein